MNSKSLWLGLWFLTGGSTLVYANSIDELSSQESIQKVEHKASKEDVVVKIEALKGLEHEVKTAKHDTSTRLTLPETAKAEQKNDSLLRFNKGSFCMASHVGYNMDKSWCSDNKISTYLKFQTTNYNKYSVGIDLVDNEVKLKKLVGTYVFPCGNKYVIGYGPSLFGNVAKVPQLRICRVMGFGKVIWKFTGSFESPLAVNIKSDNSNTQGDNGQQGDDGKKSLLKTHKFNWFTVGVGNKLYSQDKKWGVDLRLFARPLNCKDDTIGGSICVKYKMLKDKLSLTLNGLHTYGSGDYIGGLAAMQNNKLKNGVDSVSVYKNEDNQLIYVQALSVAGLVDYCILPKLILGLGGSYLTLLDKEDNSSSSDNTFEMLWSIMPKLSYKVTEYIKLGGVYIFNVEQQVNQSIKKYDGYLDLTFMF